MTESLIGKRVTILDKGWIELLDLMPHPTTDISGDLAIVNAARTSFMGESKGEERDKKLLFYLLKHRHTTPFEMVEFKFRAHAPLITWWQWARHRVWCLAGDTEITFNRPDKWKKGIHKKQSGNKGVKFTLERLYTLWQNPHHQSQIRKMLIRVYDENKKVFTISNVADVMYSGKKEVFEIELEDGKLLQCSKDHLILTNNGWQRLEDAIGLDVSISGTATMSKECFVLTNGTEDVWRSYEWMKAKRDEGLSVQEIADQAGCSYHNIRKWLKIHQLQFDKTQYYFGREGSVPWNKGKRGYSQPPRTQEHLEKLRATIKRGAESNFWRGGVTSERNLIGAWTRQQAPYVHKKYDYACQVCGKKSNDLHAHHVKPVVTHPELAYDFDNLMSVCKSCHISIHAGKEMGRNHNGTPLAPLHKKVVKVRLVGVLDTYDISVEGENHNFIANGIVVHNSFNAQSGRYTEFDENDFYVPDVWRRQAKDNKQASEGQIEIADDQYLTEELLKHYDTSYALYQDAIKRGVAREIARLFLPGFSVYYTWVMKVDAHNLMHFLRLRMASDAQYEIRVYAQAIYDHFFKPALPWTAEAFEKFILGDGE